jgi:periplasmic copper chaperone A
MARRSFLFAVCAALLTTVAVASPAAAHIDPDPKEAQAGSTLTVGFTVEHGCDGSPTIQLDMRLPDGTADVTPEPPDGWTGEVTNNVVTFVGGPLPDDQELTFRVRTTLPPTPDVTIYFPFVQRCEVGELRWIDIPTDGSTGELDEPAPAMLLIGPVATTVVAPTAPSATTVTPTVQSSTEPTTASTGAPSTTATSTESVASSSTVVVTTDDGSSGSSTGTVVLLAVGAVILGGAAALYFRARRPAV